jgi:hypothetical protein
MDLLKLLLGQAALLPGKVQNLSGDHAMLSSGTGQDGDAAKHSISRSFHLRQYPKGRWLEGISGQSRQILSIDLVAGQSAPAIVVIVHTGKIIMDQGIGVDHLNGPSCRKCRFRLPADCLAKGEAQDRAEPLSSCQEAIAHGLQQNTVVGVLCELLLQKTLNQCLLLLELRAAHR